MQPTAAQPSPLSPIAGPPRALTTPLVDLLLTGGLSIIVLGILLLVGVQPLKGSDYGTLVVLGILVNWPHFIASYRLLYADGEAVRRYRWASTWFPLLIVVYSIFALLVAGRWPLASNALLVVSGLYLARHYTGQTWGMMATFAFTGGITVAPRERLLLRGSVNVFMLWHLVWAAKQSAALVDARLVEPMARLYAPAWMLLPLGFVVGALGFGLLAARTRRLPPWRMLVPWLAVQVWYLAMLRDPSALFGAQIAHALQYLIFPLRVERNREAVMSWKPALRQLALWILIGLALFEGAEPLLRAGFQLGGGEGALPAICASVLIAAVAIHHYFIDGALYKLRNPTVRRQLFSHLR